MFTDRFLVRFLAVFDRFGMNPAPLTIEASFLVIGRVLALRLISCCKGTTFPLRLTNKTPKIFRKIFSPVLMPVGSFWSFGHLVKIVSKVSKSDTIININIYI